MESEIVVIAHNLRSSHNVGSLLRTAEGLGIKELFFTGYTPYPSSKNDERLPHIASRVNNQIHKTALGAEKLIKWQHQAEIRPLIKKLSENGYTVCALEQAEDSIKLSDFTPTAKLALVIGNEVDGIDGPTLKQIDFILEIPMLGKKESFNVVQAAAMALYTFRFP